MREQAYARRTDPEPSHEAAGRARLGKSLARTYAFMLAHAGEWMTSVYVAIEMGERLLTVSPRFVWLERYGLIERRIMPGKNSDGVVRNLVHNRVPVLETDRDALRARVLAKPLPLKGKRRKKVKRPKPVQLDLFRATP
jgi:hypothetical protein